MTTLTIRADALIMAFEYQGPEMQHFLDLQTGEVLLLIEDAVDDEEERERLEDEPERFLRIDPVPSYIGFEIMSDFVETLSEGELQRQLDRALRKSRPFRRFKDVLYDYPAAQEDWYRFHEQAFIKIIQEWLEENGVEATIVPLNSQP